MKGGESVFRWCWGRGRRGVWVGRVGSGFGGGG